MDSRLSPGLRLLLGIRSGPEGQKTWGEWYQAILEQSGVTIMVDTLPSGTWAVYRARSNTITVSTAALREDDRTIATIIAHELTHVGQTLRGVGATGACVEREVESMQHEIVIWVILYEGPAPGRTQLERYQNALARAWLNQGDPVLYKIVVDSPGYQDQCSLWVP